MGKVLRGMYIDHDLKGAQPGPECGMYTVFTGEPCPFCTTVLTDPSCWVYESNHAAAFIDSFPSAPGHMLVIPRTHASYLLEFSRIEIDSVLDLALRCRTTVDSPDATIGINDGPTAGQTVSHVHLYVIPRNFGDRPSNGSEVLRPVEDISLRFAGRDQTV